MDNKQHQILSNLGFEEREIKMYTTMIKGGTQTALQISKKTDIDRSSIYDLLKKMIHKGIVSEVIINDTKHFTVLSPNELLVHFKEKYSALENIIPELSKLSEEKNLNVNCKLFSGKNGILTVIKDLLESGEDYKAIGIREEFEEFIGYVNDQALLKLMNTNVKEIAIADKKAKFKKAPNGIYKYIDKRLMPTFSTLIYSDKVTFFLFKDPYTAIQIQNNDIRKAIEQYFDIIWESLK
jgi:sugar-specific transcriptional regulator TrmB